LLDRLLEVSLAVAAHTEHGLQERCLSRARARVLWHLAQHPPLTQRELSGFLRVSARNVTGLIDALEDSELVARAAHPSDRRATLLELTPRGFAVTRELREAHEGLAAMIFDGVSEDDAAGFLATAEHVLSRLQRSERAEEPA